MVRPLGANSTRTDNQREKARIYYAAKRAKVQAGKNSPCMDCGFEPVHPCQMDYDHRDSSQKVNSIAHMTLVREETLLAEIEKCDLICANCHRLRTLRRYKGKE